jgi:hypothetical protein
MAATFKLHIVSTDSAHELLSAFISIGKGVSRVKYIISAAMLAVCATNVAGASTITLTSGNLTAGSNTTNLAAGATGTFSATDSRSDNIVLTPDGQTGVAPVSAATATAQISSSTLSLEAISDGSTYFRAPAAGGGTAHSILGTQGSLVFEVDALTTFAYSANSPWVSSEIIKDSHGATLLSIGCQTLGFDCTNGTAFNGNLTLGQGLYTLSFTDTAQQNFGTTLDSHLNFSLQPVPLPAAAWLLVSGLFPMFSLAKRGKRARV